MSGFGGSGASIPGLGGIGAGVLGSASGGVISRAYVELLVDNSKALAGMAQTRAAVTRNAAQMSAANKAMLASQMTGAQRTAQAWGRASTSMIASGQKWMRVGVGLTRRVSVPIGLIGATAVKMALDFDTAMTKIEALGGKAGASMKELRADVMALSEQTTIAPTELANALYFVSSAGLKGSQVMEVLRASAEGAVAGMGDVGTIGQTVTSALNAYHSSGLKTAQVMDVLSEAIRQGKAEPEEYAQSLGMVMPVAAKLGVSFDQVVGAIANATNYGAEFSRSVTGMRYLLATIRNPTEEAKDILDDYGLSISEVQKMIASGPDGLLTTLQFLSDRFGENSAKGREAFATFIGGARGAVIADTLLGENLKRTQGVMDATAAAMDKGSDSFERANEAMRARPAFQFQEAMNALRIAMINLGNAILPILTNDILPVITSWVKAFADLPDAVQGTIVKFGLLAMLLGPGAMLIGGLKVMAGLAVGAASGLLTLATNAGTAVKAVAGLTAASKGVAALKGLDFAAMATKGVVGPTSAVVPASVGSSALAVGGKFAAAAALVALFVRSVEEATTSTGDLAAETGLGEDAINALRDQIDNGAAQYNLFSSDVDKVREATERYRNVLDDAVASGMDYDMAQKKINDGWGVALEQIGGLTGSMPSFEAALRSLVGLGPSPEMQGFMEFIEGFDQLPVPEVPQGTLGAGATSGIFDPSRYAINMELPEGLNTERLVELTDIRNLLSDDIAPGRGMEAAIVAVERQLGSFLDAADGAIKQGAEVSDMANIMGESWQKVGLPTETYIALLGNFARIAPNSTKFLKEIGPLLRSLEDDMRSGALSWEGYTAALAEVGAKVPYRDLHAAGQAILEAEGATRRQRDTLADSIRTYQDYGVELSNVDSQLVTSYISTGDLGAAQRTLNRAFKAAVTGGLDEYGKKLGKAATGNIQAALKAGDHALAVRLLNKAIDKFDDKKAQAKLEVKGAKEGKKEVDAAASSMSKIAKKNYRVSMEFKMDLMRRNLDTASADLKTLDQYTAKPKVDGDTSPFNKKLDGLLGKKLGVATLGVDAVTSAFDAAIAARTGNVGNATITVNEVPGTQVKHGGGLLAHGGRSLPRRFSGRSLGGGGEVDVRALSGEYLINRSSSNRFRGALEAINRGDRMAAIRALDKDGPSLVPGAYANRQASQGMESAMKALAGAVQQGAGGPSSINITVELDSDRVVAAVRKKELRRGVRG